MAIEFLVPHCLIVARLATPASTGFESCIQINDDPESPGQADEWRESCGEEQTILGFVLLLGSW